MPAAEAQIRDLTMKPAMALAKAAEHVRGVDCTPPDGRVIHPVLRDAKYTLHRRLQRTGVPSRTRKKVVARFKKWARDQDKRFPLDALSALNDVPVDLGNAHVSDLPCLTSGQVQALVDEGFRTYRDVRDADKWDLFQISGIGKQTIRKLDRLQRADLA
jgi:hypothetical protein